MQQQRLRSYQMWSIKSTLEEKARMAFEQVVVQPAEEAMAAVTVAGFPCLKVIRVGVVAVRLTYAQAALLLLNAA